MPALRRYNPSVAPVLMTGTTTTVGQSALVTDSIGPMTGGLSGEAGLGVASLTKLTVTFGSATTDSSFAFTLAGNSPGRMRQLTLAAATCGSALVAWPPSSIVATQVVRISAL